MDTDTETPDNLDVDEIRARMQDRQLARKVATIPEKSRETLARRLRNQGQDVTNAALWKEWQYWRRFVDDRADDAWKGF